MPMAPATSWWFPGSMASTRIEAFAGQWPEPSRVYVDAISGKEGHHLWHWRTELDNADTTPIWPVFWWGRGSDGWPMLAVPIGGDRRPGVAPVNRFYPPDPPVVHLLAAATGTEVHTIPGLSWPKSADLDGDGLADLWGSVDGKLCAIRGDPPEAWRALDRLQPAGDFDGDGMTDVLSNDFESPRIGPGPTDEPDRSGPFGSRRPHPVADTARSLGRLV